MGLTHILLIVILISVCHRQSSAWNATSENKTEEVIHNVDCGLRNNSCGLEEICRDGVCIKVNGTSSDGGSWDSESTETSYKVITEAEELTSGKTTIDDGRHDQPTKSHSLITGNQEFAIALVGFSLLFINFCLISFCLGRIKRRRLQQQREQRRQAATHSSQASQTGDWDSEHINRREVLDMGIDNFALNGELDAFSTDYVSPRVRLPPYDFSSAYHKPRPMTEENTSEGESSVDTIYNDVQNIDEDPPPYSDKRPENLRRPPSYDDILKDSTGPATADLSFGSGE